MCAFAYPCICIWLEIRKEARHEQWLAAFRNNVVFVGSFYLLVAQECSLQSASKFIPTLRNAIGPSKIFRNGTISSRDTMEFKNDIRNSRFVI